MTWEELKEKVKSSSVLEVWNDCEDYICVSQRANHYIKFCKNGDVCIIFDYDEDELLIAECLNPDQMYAIMESLK